MGRFGLRTASCTALLLLLSIPARAQLTERLAAYTGTNARGYFAPLVDAFAADLTAGMFHSAYIPRKSFSVSVEVRVMSVYFDDADRTFMATTEDFFQPTTTTSAPTVVGSTDLVIVDGDQGLTYVFPSGFDINRMSTAVPQFRIGSLFGTELVFRYAQFSRGGNDLLQLGPIQLDLYGFGLRHSISQYLKAPPIDLAASVFYQRFGMGEIGETGDLIETKTFSLGVQASKQWRIFEPYVGLAYDRFAVNASYERTPGDPVNLTFDWDAVAQATLGLSATVWWLNVNGEYNILSDQDYRQSAFAFGVGVQYTY